MAALSAVGSEQRRTVRKHRRTLTGCVDVGKMARLGWRGGGMIDRETSRSSNQGLGVAKGWKWTDLGCRGLTKHGGIRPYRSRMRLSIFSMNMGQFGWHYMDVVIALGNKG